MYFKKESDEKTLKEHKGRFVSLKWAFIYGVLVLKKVGTKDGKQ